MMKKTLIVFALIIATNFSYVYSNHISERNDDIMPAGDIIVDSLSNGLRYIIKPLSQNVEKNEIRLIVEAGGNHEKKGRIAIPHLLEHLVFTYPKGYKSFNNNKKLLANLGVNSSDLHAYTDSYSTIYEYYYPSNRPFALDTLLNVCYQMLSGNVDFSKDNISTERKAVYQEFLMKKQKKFYSSAKILNILNSCHAKPIPPEKFKDVIMNVKAQEIMRFYNDWYHPNYITLVIIGNFKNALEIVDKIRGTFFKLKREENGHVIKNCLENNLKNSSRFILETDVDTSRFKESFHFYFKEQQTNHSNSSGYKQKELRNLVSNVIKNRLKKFKLVRENSISVNFNYDEQLASNKLIVNSLVDSEKYIIEIFNILSGLKKFGISQQEISTAVISSIDNLQREKNMSVEDWGHYFSAKIVSGENDFTPYVEERISFLRNIDSTLIAETINSTLTEPGDITILLPSNKNTISYCEDIIRNWIRKGISNPRKAIAVNDILELLNNKEREELSIAKIKRQELGAIGEEVFLLENGLKLVLKPNKANGGRYKDKIMIHGFSRYGASCFNNSFYEALFSVDLVKNGGFGKYTKQEIERFLENTSFQFEQRFYVDQNESGFKAAFKPDDLENYLQLLYLSITAPNYSIKAYNNWKKQEALNYKRFSTENNDFVNYMDLQTGIINLSYGKFRYEKSKDIDYSLSLESYKRLFFNAQNFTVLVTGNFNANNILPFFQKYLGNLPNNSNLGCSKIENKQLKNRKIIENKIFNYSFSKPVENSYLSIRYQQPSEHIDFKSEIDLELLKAALHSKLLSLRYDQNFGVYRSSASKKITPEIAQVGIFLQAGAEEFDSILASCELFCDELRTEIMDSVFIESIKQNVYLPKWQKSTKNFNYAVMKNLYHHYNFGWKMISSKKAKSYLDQFNSQDLQRVANEYLIKSNKYIFKYKSIL